MILNRMQTPLSSPRFVVFTLAKVGRNSVSSTPAVAGLVCQRQTRKRFSHCMLSRLCRREYRTISYRDAIQWVKALRAQMKSAGHESHKVRILLLSRSFLILLFVQIESTLAAKTASNNPAASAVAAISPPRPPPSASAASAASTSPPRPPPATTAETSATATTTTSKAHPSDDGSDPREHTSLVFGKLATTPMVMNAQLIQNTPVSTAE